METKLLVLYFFADRMWSFSKRLTNFVGLIKPESTALILASESDEIGKSEMSARNLYISKLKSASDISGFAAKPTKL